MIIVLMGVAGSGKTTVGKSLSQALDCPFFDADDFHPPSNKEKMSRGVPLTDEDRKPWLAILRNEIENWEKKGPIAVLACSALKQSYRDLLSNGIKVQWVFLKGSQEAIEQRMKERKGHFAGSDLLKSQFETLEEPVQAIVLDALQKPDFLVQQIIQMMKGNELL
jgi:carbohydrate kinase (thermoresistant glucokinase family)